MGSEATSFHTKTNNIIEVEPERKELGYVGVPKKINSNDDIFLRIVAVNGSGRRDQTILSFSGTYFAD